MGVAETAESIGCALGLSSERAITAALANQAKTNAAQMIPRTTARITAPANTGETVFCPSLISRPQSAQVLDSAEALRSLPQ